MSPSTCRRGKHVRYIDTPHTPHGWDAGVMIEESTGTLMCGDLFTQLGDGPALTQGDVVSPAIAAEDLFKYSALNPDMGATRRLRPPHGWSQTGDRRNKGRMTPEFRSTPFDRRDAIKMSRRLSC
jgi:hypothetical protein